ncbi:Bug family tripartite tricarboxylate transporter substrate binding protein [Cupriavidus oxalaticus]|jgi:tripartite-type tricarboxylate transporter receptor subunit TctC|uniref:Extra-cytoplasmic solute receptor n=1 Tax=Cupriavidus oxalaticus TaxID=96344 RepID=A0A375GMF3_9BURK|nr:tripartite tricarboxylate transporter substrate binding protein [Cupriavidus oxalaticus]QEZ42938.1 tripartite tricarboxylate transporter substrate binding protein [Cupriavidus oxalaticus]QRQ83461.1 tripartite tricarboxylate transporter substrate binding protein [Cupriavidus oxalaticus]QRQ92450.1 tripartite tricarboxylate transporter substrate binding protein [Cupriavidus oxalaticus]WQD87068.1 tripartite tricarboxylate transporter substrate binding protein [Cupriavidus oxalaticus]SPC07644.1 
MKTPTRRRALLAVTAMAAVLATGAAAAQGGYPTRPVTLVVAYPAGGDTDVLARLFAEKLTARLGQPVVVENRTGAAGTIGSAYVAKAPADGYTLLFAPNTLAIAPLVLKPGTGASYDPQKDFTPIIELGKQSLFIIVNKEAGVTKVSDLVARAKSGSLQSYASPGNGSPMHILGELFNKSAGVKLAQVPYRGSAPAIVDLLGGQVPMMFSTLGPVSQYFASGKLAPLAVADQKRSPFAPNVPTLVELGYKDVDVGAWQAVVGPKGMAPELVGSLNKHFNEILKMPDVVARMATIATTPVGGDPATLRTLIANDYARYGKLVREFGIQAD